MKTLTEQIESAKRELKLRKWIYPNRVDAEFMTQKTADHEIACMEAIIKTLEGLQPQQVSLFDAPAPVRPNPYEIT